MPEVCNFIKKETLAQMFFCEFCESLKNTFFHRTRPVAATEIYFSGTYHLQLIHNTWTIFTKMNKFKCLYNVSFIQCKCFKNVRSSVILLPIQGQCHNGGTEGKCSSQQILED